MSYRLITKALLTITSADGVKSERIVECRLYPVPKRDAAGTITIDGKSESFKRTGGKGRGTTDNRYMYATVKGQAAFWAITEPEATALAGGTATLTSVEQAAPDAPAVTSEERVIIQAAVDKHGAEAVVAAANAKPEGQKAQRRQGKREAATA